jgi:hypothetical protein
MTKNQDKAFYTIHENDLNEWGITLAIPPIGNHKVYCESFDDITFESAQEAFEGIVKSIQPTVKKLTERLGVATDPVVRIINKDGKTNEDFEAVLIINPISDDWKKAKTIDEALKYAGRRH